MAKAKEISLYFDIDNIAEKLGEEVILSLQNADTKPYLQELENIFNETQDKDLQKKICDFLVFCYKVGFEKKIVRFKGEEIAEIKKTNNLEKYDKFASEAFKNGNQIVRENIVQNLENFIKNLDFANAINFSTKYGLYNAFCEKVFHFELGEKFFAYFKGLERSNAEISPKTYYLFYSLLKYTKLSIFPDKEKSSLKHKYLLKAADSLMPEALNDLKLELLTRIDRKLLNKKEFEEFKSECENFLMPSLVSYYYSVKNSDHRENIKYCEQAIRKNLFPQDELGRLYYYKGLSLRALKQDHEAFACFKESSEAGDIFGMAEYISYQINNPQATEEEIAIIFNNAIQRISQEFGEKFLVKDVKRNYHSSIAEIYGSYALFCEKILKRNPVLTEKYYQKVKELYLRALSFDSNWTQNLMMLLISFEKDQKIKETSFTRLQNILADREKNNELDFRTKDILCFLGSVFLGNIENYKIFNEDEAFKNYKKADEISSLNKSSELKFLADYCRKNNKIEEARNYYSRALMHEKDEEKIKELRSNIVALNQPKTEISKEEIATKNFNVQKSGKSLVKKSYYEEFLENFNPKDNNEAILTIINAICEEPSKNRGQDLRLKVFSQLKGLILENFSVVEDSDKLKKLIEKGIEEAAYPYFLLVQKNDNHLQKQFAQKNLENLVRSVYFTQELSEENGAQNHKFYINSLLDLFKFKVHAILRKEIVEDDFFKNLTEIAKIYNPAFVNIYIAKIKIENEEYKQAEESFKACEIALARQEEIEDIYKEISSKIIDIRNKFYDERYEKNSQELKKYNYQENQKKKNNLAKQYINFIFLINQKILNKEKIAAINFASLNEAIEIVQKNNLLTEQDIVDALSIAMIRSSDNNFEAKNIATRKFFDLTKKGLMPYNYCFENDIDFYQQFRSIPQFQKLYEDKLSEIEDMNNFLKSTNEIKKIDDLPKFVADIFQKLQTDPQVEKIFLKGSKVHLFRGFKPPRDLDISVYIKDIHKKTPQEIFDFVKEKFDVNQKNISIYDKDGVFTINVKDDLRKMDISIYSNEKQPNPYLSWVASFETNLRLNSDGTFSRLFPEGAIKNASNFGFPDPIKALNQQLLINNSARKLISRLCYYTTIGKIHPESLTHILSNEPNIDSSLLAREFPADWSSGFPRYEEKIISHINSYGLQKEEALGYLGFLYHALTICVAKNYNINPDFSYYFTQSLNKVKNDFEEKNIHANSATNLKPDLTKAAPQLRR